MKTAVFVLVVSALLLSACGNIRPTPDQINLAYYGPPPTDPEGAVFKYFEERLIDPESARIKCSNPRKGWVNLAGKLSYGWVCICSVNAKNRFGGYAGAKEYRYLFHGEQIVKDYWAVHEYLE